MGRIHILPDQVANKIAAGEVIERPASIVKELLENSLDADASHIRIDVESGGRKLVRVADDGCGMLKDDALLAFERHATSKLSDVKDLLCISTLGFRGEALPSIASVSRLVLETRSAEELSGIRIEIAGGRLLKAEECALSTGTTVSVRDLFYNVPARRKFLRSEQTELAYIAALVTHYSLAHPDKTFLLRSESKDLLHVTPVAALRERLYQVFGGQLLQDLVEIPVQQRELGFPLADYENAATAQASSAAESKILRLYGFVSRPQFQKLNRKSIFLFVNHRLIHDRLLLHALSSAYYNLIPQGCFPFALLFLECDYSEVDVNVHPSKTEVRFRHGPAVHDFVRDTVRQALLESKPAPTLPVSARMQPAASLPYSEFSQQLENQRWVETIDPTAIQQQGSNLSGALVPELMLRPVPGPSPRLDLSGSDRLDKIEAGSEAPLNFVKIPATHREFPEGAWADEAGSMLALSEARPLGQIHDSFIVAAGRDGLWIIDQHVAHERILFERLLKQCQSGSIEKQTLLLPLLLELTPAQQVEYARISGELRALGFEIEPFGQRTIAIKAAPADVGQADIEKILFEVLEMEDRELRKLSINDLRRAVAASIACHAAIKINTKLDQSKMEWLLAALCATDYPMSCPHGRPVALRYSTREILRSFHRI
jgi:DNA mismatch repair protein MutL